MWQQRLNSLPSPSPADRLVLRAGTLGDYDALAGFHYLRGRPVTATRVWVMEEAWGVGLEACGASCEYFPSSPRPHASSRVVAVLVESLPCVSCVLRDVATGGRYAGLGGLSERARAVNAEVRCISRVVVHPQWRGLGLGAGLVKHALATMTTVYTEALAAMGRVHPLFELAGMRAYRGPRLKKDRRLLDALASCGVEAWELMRLETCGLGLGVGKASLKPHASSLLRRELTRWAGRGRSLEEALKLARERLMGEKFYYLKRREAGAEPPPRRGGLPCEICIEAAHEKKASATRGLPVAAEGQP